MDSMKERIARYSVHLLNCEVALGKGPFCSCNTKMEQIFKSLAAHMIEASMPPRNAPELRDAAEQDKGYENALDDYRDAMMLFLSK